MGWEKLTRVLAARRGGMRLALASAMIWAALCTHGAAAAEFRAFWADAFSGGFKSQSQINTMLSQAVVGRYNAIFVEVMAYQDTGAVGHGAYWNSSIVPPASDISGGIDPLARIIQGAHNAGIEVHVWLVPYRVCNTWPPSGNSYLAARDEWTMVYEEDMGGGPTKVDGHYLLDPGSPDAQNYLASIVREIATNYEVDGIHLDYIRYTDSDAGYPARTTYARSGLERFRSLTGFVGTPPSSGEESWDAFRRQEINELVRRCYVETHAAENPRQPLRFTAAVIASGDAPSDFSNSGVYRTLFQDWKGWLDEGWLDAACPMNYKREHCSNQASWYRNWIDAAVSWKGDRHVFCGQANYLNSFDNSVLQMTYSLTSGADGTVNYAYAATRSSETLCDDADSSRNDLSWYSYIAANLFTQSAVTPSMPWHDPATSRNGLVYGRVVDGATGRPVDNATIKLGSFAQTTTDGNGFYLYKPPFDPGASGQVIPLSAELTGVGTATRTRVLVERAGFTEINFALGGGLPGDRDVDGDVDSADFFYFAECVTGPANGPIAPGCDLFDFDADNDVDAKDYAVFHGAFTG